MEELNRLGWAAGLSIVAFGVRFGIRSTSKKALEQVIPHLPLGSKECASNKVELLYSLIPPRKRSKERTRSRYLLYSGQHRLFGSRDFEKVGKTLEEDMLLHVSRWSTRRIFVHAGAVGWKGTGILLPGGTRTGKSTLVAELVKAGATYYSDEHAVLDEKGRVHPYPRPLSLRRGAGKRARKVPVEELGGVAGKKPIPVALVFATRYEAGRVWRPRRITPGRAVLELLAHTIPARRVPERAVATLRFVAERATVIKGVRGEASEIAKALLDRCEQAEI